MIASDPTANGRCRNSSRSSSSDSSEFGEESSYGAHESAAAEAPSDPLGPLLLHLRELREYAGIYCAARIDQWWIASRKLALGIAVGLIGALFGMTALIVAAALFVNGIATGIGILCGGRIWLGQLIVGGWLVLVALSGVGLVSHYLRITELRRVINKYETRKRRERSTFGTDVDERARERDA